ncbi:Uncharacterised protein g1979 [Pycnogonum litorale]
MVFARLSLLFVASSILLVTTVCSAPWKDFNGLDLDGQQSTNTLQISNRIDHTYSDEDEDDVYNKESERNVADDKPVEWIAERDWNRQRTSTSSLNDDWLNKASKNTRSNISNNKPRLNSNVVQSRLAAFNELSASFQNLIKEAMIRRHLAQRTRVENQFEKKRGLGSHGDYTLSIVNPLEVLRRRLELEMARRRMKANRDQIKANEEILKNLG